jgi:hypothetical protein
MEIPIKFTEQRLIDIKDDYLGLVSDTYDEMTRNREKVDPTIAPRATITGQDDFEPVCFGAKSPRETPKFIPQFGD